MMADRVGQKRNMKKNKYFTTGFSNGSVNGWTGWTPLSDFLSRRHVHRRLFLRHIIVILVVYALTFFVVLPAYCKNKPSSFYYDVRGNRDRDFKYAIQLNQNRLREDQRHIETLNSETTRQKYDNNNANVHMAIGVITVDRSKHKKSPSNPKYLTQVLSRLDQGLAHQSLGHINKIFICNVDSKPNDHSEARELSRYFPMVTKSAPNVESELTLHRKDIGLRARLSKEKEDYVFCLNYSRSYNSKYVLLVQDDAIPEDGFYEQLNYLLENKLERRYVQGRFISNRGEWAFLKLNFPDPLAAFPRHWWFVCEGIAIAAFAAGIVANVYETFYRRKHRELSVKWTYFILLVGFLYFGIASHLIGRQYFIHLREKSNYFYDIRPGTSCCIPAVLYPSTIIPNITNYLLMTNLASPYPVDFALADFVTSAKMQQYITFPNLFSHIGLFSSLHVSTVGSVQF